ncbi:uncharacterized protein [Euphorbia lathyris]|uniref:uncharacterized protein n=1 Tax=Euphorbia lathyris TaxID=212925 RepID=UPI0033142610
MVRHDRMWMYNRLMSNGRLTREFVDGVAHFVGFAITKPRFMNDDHIRCPCTRCANRRFEHPNDCKVHLYKYGFLPNYWDWINHGEAYNSSSSRQVEEQVYDQHPDPISPLRQCVYDAIGPELSTQMTEEEPNPESRKFFDMLRSLDEELYDGCENHSVLSMMARLLNIKSENHMTERCFDSVLEAIHEALPSGNKMAKNFYETKKLIQGLGLPVEKIDCCVQGCMLFWKDDNDLLTCKVCGHARFKPRHGSRKHKLIPFRKMVYFPLTPRLRRLFASKATAEHMRWHHNHVCDEETMCHPCDSEAWKHFNHSNESFAAESRNVRLGLCTDGFQPFGQSGKQYSSWPIIVTPYNLPPWMCMKDKYMFLTALVPGPNNPKQKIDVFLQPLIHELMNLWENGVDAYDVSLKQNFTLRAALMWTISDFPAYSMLSGWTTAGKNACPYCMEHSDAFSLPNGRKTSWFDNHRKFLPMNHTYRNNKVKFRRNYVERRCPPPIKSGQQIFCEIQELGLLRVTDPDSENVNKQISNRNCGWKKRSIFWDLPYWKTNLIRHNLDVMHIEKNVFENVFNTVMNIDSKTKDNGKAREDIGLFCNRPELLKNPVTGIYPKSCYSLSQNQKKLVCDWVKLLRFPDGYVSNLGRCVDDKKAKLFGMKSHDCHVFMQRLLPIALRENLPKKVWEAITELSCFFKNLTANVIKVNDMAHLQDEIPIILCKLEMIFPPGFFDSMEHLPIHLPYEAKVAGPVQYRWMYPFERYLGRLKKSVKNKAQVEGSICNAYLVEESSNFCSYYFEPQVYTRHRKVPRNDDGGDDGVVDKSNLMIFSYNGRHAGPDKTRWLDEKEHDAIHSYVLLNSAEVRPYVELYKDHLQRLHPGANNATIESDIDKNFANWFSEFCQNNVVENKCVANLAFKPSRMATSFNIYFVNGYRFHTTTYSGNRTTSNNGVCVFGDGIEYYGVIDEIIQVSYLSLSVQKTGLFKCKWYDPTPNVGFRVHDRYNIVEVNTKRYFKKYEPFILSLQATQVYFAPYPSLKRDKADWVVVCSVKAKGVFDIPENKVASSNDAFQEEEAQLIEVEVSNNDDVLLNDESDPYFEFPTGLSEEEGEEEATFETDTEAELSDEIDFSDNDSD